jgi:hypothetical protein
VAAIIPSEILSPVPPVLAWTCDALHAKVGYSACRIRATLRQHPDDRAPGSYPRNLTSKRPNGRIVALPDIEDRADFTFPISAVVSMGRRNTRSNRMCGRPRS